MEKSKIESYLATNQEKLPAEKMPMILAALEKMPDEKLIQLQSVSYKDPLTMLLISLFLGYIGVDRFMLGQTGLGVAKLLTAGGCGIWTIIDWVKINGMTKDYNFKKLMQVADPTSFAAFG